MQVTGHSTIARGREARHRSPGAVALACLLAVLGLAGCGESETYRYRMTVYVDTPAGQRSGSSVIEVVTSPAVMMGSTQSDVRGEAVAVDLPDGTLFALLRSPTNRSAAANYAYNAYRHAFPSGAGRDWRTSVDILMRQTGPGLLTRADYPQFVRFRDPRDARTIRPLDPAYLDTSFGRGVRLNRIEIQMTQDPVTETIDARLPNFGAGSGFDPMSQVSRSDFRQGFE